MIIEKYKTIDDYKLELENDIKLDIEKAKLIRLPIFNRIDSKYIQNKDWHWNDVKKMFILWNDLIVFLNNIDDIKKFSVISLDEMKTRKTIFESKIVYLTDDWKSFYILIEK